jgi:rhodanese-related sulfurtransferase
VTTLAILFAILHGRLLVDGHFLRFRKATNDSSSDSPIAFIQLDALRASKKDEFLFIDARSPLFFNRGHIPGAVNIAQQYFARDFSNAEPILRRAREKRIIVYCSTEDCDDAMAVAQQLLNAGIKNVSVFTGGWKAWCAAALPQEGR